MDIRIVAATNRSLFGLVAQGVFRPDPFYRNKRRACQVLDISYHTLQVYVRYSEHPVEGHPRQTPAWARGGAPGRSDRPR